MNFRQFFAKFRFALAMYFMFGGFPLTVLGLLIRFREKLTFRNVTISSISYYIFSKLTASPLGHDSMIWRQYGKFFLAPLYKEKGGRVIFPDKPLDASKRYILAASPHGVVAFLWGVPINQLNLGPHQKPAIALGARFLYRFPIVRDLFLMSSVEGTPENAAGIFKAGRSVFVVPGGVPEMILSEPGNKIKVYCKNTGFVKLALEHGVDIIPMFGFGEQNQWIQKSIGPKFVSNFFARIWGGLYPTIPWGSFGPFLPFDAPVVQVVGDAVSIPHIPTPTKEEVIFHHERFYQALADLILSRCDEAGFPTIEVEFIGLEHLNIRIPKKSRRRQKKQSLDTNEVLAKL